MATMAENLRSMGQMKLLIMSGIAVALMGFFLILSMQASSPLHGRLYANLSTDDSRYIIEELEALGIPYTVEGGGSEILVPPDQILRLKMLLSQKGLPSSSSNVGYEIFDKTESLGTSNFVLNMNKKRALEGELSRTIAQFSNIDVARVHLVVPKKRLFKREQSEPTASIALKIRNGTLTKEEIAAVRHLVATAVPGLKPSKVTIVDSKGKLLARGASDDNDIEYMASTSQEFRINFENRTKQTIERLLEQTIGIDKVKAEVHAEIDFDRIETNSEIYDPEGQVVRSVQSVEEIETLNENEGSGNVAVKQNLPDAGGGESTSASERNIQRSDETTNYEISKTIKHHVKETGVIKKLSVAVLVDGIYEENEDGDYIYRERDEEELKQLHELVASAIGFNEERGDTLKIINMKFVHRQEDIFEEDSLSWLKEDMENIIQTIVLAGLAMLVILTVIKPLVMRAIAASQASQEEEELEQSLLAGTIMGQLPDLTEEDEEEELISIARIRGGVRSSAFRKIGELIDQHPEESLNIIRQWAFPNAN